MEKRRVEKDAVDDLVLLEDLSEKGVVKNLKNRFEKDMIYTYIGDVLVSVNPYKQINGLYTKDLMQRYFGRQKFELAPHVFATAEQAFRELMTTAKNQCVLISGESGAGKTEAAKKLLEYVTVVASDRAEVNKGGLTVREIKDALLQSNPVLEAFGNAKTLRNDNSSRFGKYMVINFDYGGTPLGGNITSYLLEKPRVVRQTEGERNFHVFYQLCAGGESGLGSADEYRYTKGTTKVKGKDDSADFKGMKEALGVVGVKGADKDNVFKLVASVLHLGNIEFEKKGDKCAVKSGSALGKAAGLLSVSEADLAKALTNRTIASKNETVCSPLTTVEECETARDALAKVLYSRNFLRLIEMINVTIKSKMQELSIGVLDIYGFEIFKMNSFEQLCINFCNEKLQQLFIELTLKAEQEEYAREGIKWTPVTFFNNKIVCELIEGRTPSPGIFAFMDEECTFPKGTDKTYLKKLEANMSKHPHYGSLTTKVNNDPSEFLIKHYAGDVTYSVIDMLEKNRDTLFPDLKSLVQSSKQEYFRGLVPELHDGKKPTTASFEFVRNMQALIDDLNKCEPHYIRTIKPNEDKASGKYDEALVTHQVRYLGVVENVRVRRAGFAFRSEYNYFVKHFKMLSKATWPKGSGNAQKDTQAILKEIGVSDYEMGKTKVFVREPQSVFKLESAREKRMHEVVKVIQKAYRGFKDRVYFMRLREDSANYFLNKKRRRGSWVLYFMGDYIRAQENAAITAQIDGRVKFADMVQVKDGQEKMVKMMMVVTSSSIFLFEEVEDKKQKPPVKVWTLRHAVKFAAIKEFGMSTFADGFMVIDYQSGQPQTPTLIIESVRKCEITTVIREESNGKLPVVFKDSFPILATHKTFFGQKWHQKTLTFTENPAIVNAEALIVQKKENPEHKTTVKIGVSPKLASKAQLQLNSPLPDRLVKYHLQHANKGPKKVYGGAKMPEKRKSSPKNAVK